jgi:hypothetical protein
MTSVVKMNAANVKGKDFVFEVHEGVDTLCVQAGTRKEMDEWMEAMNQSVSLFTEATTSSKTSDHFAHLILHMNMARSICQRLLKLTTEYNEAEKEESVKRQVSFFFLNLYIFFVFF